MRRRFSFLLFVPFAEKFHDLKTRESALSNACLQNPLMTSDGRLSFALAANVSLYHVTKCSITKSFTVHYKFNYTEIGRFTPILSITIVLSCFYPLISHFENFST